MKLKVLFFMPLVMLAACTGEELLPIDGDPATAERNREIVCNDTLKVGPDKAFKTIREASLVATDSTLIEVDAGTYRGDVTVWRQNELYLRAVGGEVILNASGKSWEGKAIWEINGGNVKVEGFTFTNVTVPDRNGAGIRFVKGRLTVENCKFLHSECGILTANSGGVLIVRNTEFGYMGNGDGMSHNIYVGRIDTFRMTASYSHHAREGHLVKCRARFSLIMNNRISNENNNTHNASYELDLPDGGTHIVVGNIIQQSEQSPNTAIIAFGEESNTQWKENALYLSHNTILNSKATTNPLFIPSSRLPNQGVVMLNNLLSDNIALPAANLLSVDKGNQKYRKGDLNANYLPSAELFESLKGKTEPEMDTYLSTRLKREGFTLIPAAEYAHPCQTLPLKTPPAIAGAMQQSVK
ncbi:MAG: hypothetical protein LBS05_01895 [Tannerellaceae bacterium]|jgi:hypothetical protein|nr:hypothetical protein [Tannerellaceae bacterium]